MKIGRWAALLLALCGLGSTAGAHPLAPALLQLHETAPGHYDVLWRTSVTRTQRLDVAPVLPSSCIEIAKPQIATEGGDAVVARWQVQCASGLTGQRIAVQGLAQSGINVIVHLRSAAGAVDALLGPDQTTFTVAAPAAQPPVFVSYLWLGVSHLFAGLDHLLFVAGLVLLVRGWPSLLATVTAFTLGHSATLALASLGLIAVPQDLTELGIALSILLLAVEVARPASAAPSLLRRQPWRMAAGFGLLHGLGFAGALAETGLPKEGILQALLAFNIGIELGQLLWVLVLLIVAKASQNLLKNPSEAMVRMLPAYVIGVLAAYWCWDRLVALWA